MSTITKQDLVNGIVEKTQLKPAMVKTIIRHVLDQIVVELAQDNRIELRNFGVFEPWTRGGRAAVNPRTMARIHVPAKRAVRFKMGCRMKTTMDAAVCQEAQPMGRSEPSEQASGCTQTYQESRDIS